LVKGPAISCFAWSYARQMLLAKINDEEDGDDGDGDGQHGQKHMKILG